MMHMTWSNEVCNSTKWYIYCIKVFQDFSFYSYTFTIKSDTRNLITWNLECFGEFPIFYSEGGQDEPKSQDEYFSEQGILIKI
jgi:hypothetical protein